MQGLYTADGENVRISSAKDFLASVKSMLEWGFEVRSISKKDVHVDVICKQHLA